MFQRVEFQVQFHHGGAVLGGPVTFLLDFQAPIIREPRRTRVLLAGRELVVVQVKLGFIGAGEQH
jgi:hypothetical protein